MHVAIKFIAVIVTILLLFAEYSDACMKKGCGGDCGGHGGGGHMGKLRCRPRKSKGCGCSGGDNGGGGGCGGGGGDGMYMDDGLGLSDMYAGAAPSQSYGGAQPQSYQFGETSGGGGYQEGASSGGSQSWTVSDAGGGGMGNGEYPPINPEENVPQSPAPAPYSDSENSWQPDNGGSDYEDEIPEHTPQEGEKQQYQLIPIDATQLDLTKLDVQAVDAQSLDISQIDGLNLAQLDGIDPSQLRVIPLQQGGDFEELLNQVQNLHPSAPRDFPREQMNSNNQQGGFEYPDDLPSGIRPPTGPNDPLPEELARLLEEENPFPVDAKAFYDPEMETRAMVGALREGLRSALSRLRSDRMRMSRRKSKA